MTNDPFAGAFRGGAFSPLVVALIAFFTVVDLFATQAILPLLALDYGQSPAAVSVAVNASTLGMAVAAIGIAVSGVRIERRTGIVVSLVLLAIPTAMLAHAPGLTVFALLRIAQGLCMSTAFALTLAHLGERIAVENQASAFAAYVTGNVASNLVGRFVAANVAGSFGVATNFYLFAALNLAGAALAWATIPKQPPMVPPAPGSMPEQRLRKMSAPPLLAAYGVGFCILFAFIGVFTYVNFVLVRPPLALGMDGIGLVYLVFLPSIVTTPTASRVVARLGTRGALWTGLGIAAAGLVPLVQGTLPPVLLGMALVGVGTFLAQAVATGFVGRASGGGTAANGCYLAAYFSGGLVGTAVLGMVFESSGWVACVAAVGLALGLAALIGSRFDRSTRMHGGPI